MQLNIIALLAAISTAVSAAPVDGGVSPAIMDNALVVRTTPDKLCCPERTGVAGGTVGNCKACEKNKDCPSKHDTWTKCSFLGLDIFDDHFCNVQHGVILSFRLDILIGILSVL